MAVTQFPARANGIAERMAGFTAHLRMNAMAAGPRETEAALEALTRIDATNIGEVRLALRSVLASGAEAWERFDPLFDAYWLNAGRARGRTEPAPHRRSQAVKPALWQQHLGEADSDGASEQAAASADTADDGENAAETGDGRLIASRGEALTRRDLRELTDPETLAEAERIARRLGASLRARQTRRRRAARRGAALDLRRMIRASLPRGGEPVDLKWRRRIDRPLQIVAVCDVSGSMTVHALVFLAFLKGVIGSDAEAEAYLFHTRLLRVTPALRDRDTLRSAGRLSLMAEGFGGGTDIAACVGRLTEGHLGAAMTRRMVVILLSDGYCTQPPEALAAAISRLRHRVRRVIWLNPVARWDEIEPISRGIAAAKPHLDALYPARTLADLAALEPEFARL